MKCLISAVLLISLSAVTHFASNFSFIIVLKFYEHMYVVFNTKQILARKTLFFIAPILKILIFGPSKGG